SDRIELCLYSQCELLGIGVVDADVGDFAVESILLRLVDQLLGPGGFGRDAGFRAVPLRPRLEQVGTGHALSVPGSLVEDCGVEGIGHRLTYPSIRAGTPWCLVDLSDHRLA